jgi:hypothetical protein
MKKSLFIIYAIFLIAIITGANVSAQKTTKYKVDVKAVDVYGKWKVAEVRTMNAFLGIPEPKETTASTDTLKNPKEGQQKDTIHNTIQKERIRQHLLTFQSRSSLELSPGNTGIKYIGSTPFNFTWKLKKNIITAKIIKTKEKFTIEVVKFSPDQLMVIEHNQYGDTYVSYKRERK